MEFYGIHHVGTKHQSTDGSSWIPTSGEDRSPIGDESQVMLGVFPPNENGNIRIETTDDTDDFEDNCLNFNSPWLPALCPVTTSRGETNTTRPTQNELLAQQAKNWNWQRALTTVTKPRLCNFYDCYGILDYNAHIGSAVPRVMSNPFDRPFSISRATRTWENTPASV